MLSLKTCLSFQLSAWLFIINAFKLIVFLSLSVTLDIHLSSPPLHISVNLSLHMRNVRICIPHLSSKTQLKTWPLTSSGISAQLFQKFLDLACIIEKSALFSTDILKVTFMILICLIYATFLSAANDRKKSQAWVACACENVCVCVSENTIMKFMIWQTAEQLVWLSQLAEPAHCLIHRQFSVGWTEAQTHSYNSCDVSL